MSDFDLAGNAGQVQVNFREGTTHAWVPEAHPLLFLPEILLLQPIANPTHYGISALKSVSALRFASVQAARLASLLALSAQLERI